MSEMIDAVWRMDWTEYERGWGQRPDGSTYYETEAEANAAYARAFEGRGGATPECYSNPGKPYLSVRPNSFPRKEKPRIRIKSGSSRAETLSVGVVK